MEYNRKKLRAENITLAKEYRGITQKELAKILNISQGTLSKIENDIAPIFVEDELAKKICDILHFPIEFFLTEINQCNFIQLIEFEQDKN